MKLLCGTRRRLDSHRSSRNNWAFGLNTKNRSSLGFYTGTAFDKFQIYYDMSYVARTPVQQISTRLLTNLYSIILCTYILFPLLLAVTVVPSRLLE
jgi:hypothetical protein